MPNPSLCCDCGGGSGSGSLCVYLGLPCEPGGVVSGQSVTINGPSGYTATLTTDSEGKVCFTPPSTGLYSISAPAPGVTGVGALSEPFVFLSAGQAGALGFSYPIASGYWCPCGVGPSARATAFEFEAFGQTVAATFNTVNSYIAEIDADGYVLPAGVLTGGTVTVSLEFNYALCVLTLTYANSGGGTLTYTWDSTVADITYGGFSFATKSANPFDPSVGWTPARGTVHPGPYPTGIVFREA